MLSRTLPLALLAVVCIQLAAPRAKAQGAHDAEVQGGPSQAGPDLAIHGRLELSDMLSFSPSNSLPASLGAKDYNDAGVNLRLAFKPTWGDWTVDIQYVATGQDGESVVLDRTQTLAGTAPPSTWLNLTGTSLDRGHVLVQDGFDRLSLTYSVSDVVVRIGRQALSWGSGLVFRPMDLFDPFSPTAIDTEFKPGTDMIYAQYLFPDGSDLQAIAVPRSEHPGESPTADASSFALHYRGRILGMETTMLLARDRGDWTAGLGVSGQVAGATWNVELVPTAVHSGAIVLSGIANASYAAEVGGHNARLFAEYFRNGFGVLGSAVLEDLPISLQDRLLRGQLFNVRRDYIAAGMTLEWSPLVTFNPTVIAGLDDASLDIISAVTWSLGDNLVLEAGAQSPLGRRGSEFGGLRLNSAGPITSAPPEQFYLQLRKYF